MTSQRHRTALLRPLCLGAALVLWAATASAGIHTWDVNEVFTNADGSIQFVELIDNGAGGGEINVGNGTISSNTQTYAMSEGAVVGPTNGRHYLIATAGFAALPGAPTPDAIIPPANIPFFAAASDSVAFGGFDTLAVTSAPTNGTDSYNAGGVIAANSPTNYAGAAGSVNASPPPPPVPGGRSLSMSGQWFQNRGPLVDIPNNGGAVPCFPTNFGNISDGCLNNLRPVNGGIPAGSQPISVTGGSPANFSIVNNAAFGQAGGAGNRATVPVNGIPTVIQLASQFTLAGPALTTVQGGGGAASFQANAWNNDPGQAGRLVKDFTWCPPGGACTGGIGTSLGAYQAVLKYTEGANAFGGTMGMMLSGTAVVSIRVNTPAPSGPRVLHQLVGSSAMAPSPQMGGGGYANARTITLNDGPLHLNYTIPLPCTTGFGESPSPAGCGIIGAQGPQIATLPGSMNKDWGMPWITGTVFAKNLGSTGPDSTTTFSAMGSDSRTGAGAGTITMVAGATSQRIPSTNHFSALEIVTMTFAPQTPALSAPAIVALVSLMVLAGGYMVRRRFVPTH